jgi:hypothetical protein
MLCISVPEKLLEFLWKTPVKEDDLNGISLLDLLLVEVTFKV